MDKVIVRLYVPMIEEQYDLWIPLNRRIFNVIELLVKSVNELSGGYYKPEKMPLLYDKLTSKVFDVNSSVINSTIRNGTEIVLI